MSEHRSDHDTDHRRGGARRRLIGREPDLSPPIEVLLRYQARVLDPVSAPRLGGQRLAPTVYLAGRILVRDDDGVLTEVERVAGELGLELIPEEDDRRLAELLPGRAVFVRVDLKPGGDRADRVHTPADAWDLVQAFRAEHPDSATDIALDHLLTACRPVIGGVPFIGSGGIGGVPFIGSGGIGGVPFIGSGGIGVAAQQYAVPGLGGRMPVTWVGPRPAGLPGLTGRRPVVAVIDTEIGEHDWFTADVVERNPTVDGRVIGLGGHDPAVADRLEGVLDADTGHGTFIAGLIHQRCPDARLLGIRVMSTVGAVREGDLLGALWQLVRRQERAQQPDGRAEDLVDIVNLSLGYYHESAEDFAYDSALLTVLTELSRLGVIVVAAAGNGSTDRWMFPAAFAPETPEQSVKKGDEPRRLPTDRVPLVSVGAKNPDSSVALYSNTGPWVTTYRPGVNLVSTMSPKTNGGAHATFDVTLPGYPPRATLDPDSFASGFAVWSGTSFAAPVLAGELAAALLDQRERFPLDPSTPQDAVGRAWAALRARVEELKKLEEVQP